jgi:hypothetical protein
LLALWTHRTGNALRTRRAITGERNIEHGFVAACRVLLGIKSGDNAVEAECELRDDGNPIIWQVAIDPILHERGNVEGDPVPFCRQSDRGAAYLDRP